METNNSSSGKPDVYQIVTDRIIDLLEQNTVPWQKPWTDGSMPRNLISKRAYRGINFWLLLCLDYEVNFFLTWDQIKKLGGSVRQGEHGHVVIFWKTQTSPQNELENSEPQVKRPPLLRYYKVFNIAQCRDLPDNLIEPLVPKEHDVLPECQAIITAMPQCPEIRHKEQLAFYHIGEDYINMPKKKTFQSAESYYATLFHELVHSTGSEKRLNRKTVTEMYEFGSEEYSIEELIAEIGSAYLSASAGVGASELRNNAAYIKGWLTKLKNDKRFIIQASGMAQKAVDFILNNRAEVNEQVLESMSIPEELPF